MADAVRQQLLDLAKLHQRAIHPQAARYIATTIAEQYTPQDVPAALANFFAVLKEVTSSHLTQVADATKCFELLQSKPSGGTEISLAAQVVSLSDVPIPIVDETRLTCQAEPKSRRTQPLSVPPRVFAQRQRYFFALARTLRSGLYERGRSATGIAKPLLTISSLEGVDSQETVCVLGLLRRVSGVATGSELLGSRHVELADQWVLEDPIGTVAVDFTGCATDPMGVKGVFAEGLLVIVEGNWVGALLRAKGVSLPPAEARQKSLVHCGGQDLFGLRPTDMESTLRVEREGQGAVIVFLAHVHLDRPQTLNWLSALFAEFQSRTDIDLSSVTFVIIGDFRSSPAPLHLSDLAHQDDAASERHQYRSSMDSFSVSIHAVAPNVATSSTFIFVPGPSDPSVTGQSLPQSPIPSIFTAGIRRRCPKSFFAPNPCRLRWCTQEIVVCRSDFYRTLWRRRVPELHHPLGSSSAASTPYDNLVKTIVDEGHLFPSVVATPLVRWNEDAALQLFPLPSILILCDRGEQWDSQYQGTLVMCPGSFAHNSTFLWLTPSDHSYVFNRVA